MSDTSEPDGAGPDGTGRAPTARQTRASVMLSATVERFGGGGSSRHRVRDLSAGGIRLDQAAAFPVGAMVLISVGTLQAVGATVMWVDKGSAGLRFVEPIDPDAARAKTAITPRAKTPAPPDTHSGPTAGWMPDLSNPYRKP